MVAVPGAVMVPTAFNPPGPEDFNIPPVWDSVPWLTKPVLLGVLAGLVIAVYFLRASRRLSTVPSKSQFVAEYAYNFARNNIARDTIGPDFIKYVPYLAALFFFILVNNLFGSIPLLQFPTFSHVGWAYAAAGLSWLVYNGAGIWVQGGKSGHADHHGDQAPAATATEAAAAKPNPIVRVFVGLGRYLKLQTMPSGVPTWLLPLLIPIEFISNILVRPVSLSLRLFANMFAGHLLLALFVLGGQYMIFETHNVGLAGAGIATWIVGLPIAGLEIFVQAIQAFIFAVLAAQYIGGAISDAH